MMHRFGIFLPAEGRSGRGERKGRRVQAQAQQSSDDGRVEMSFAGESRVGYTCAVQINCWQEEEEEQDYM